MRQYEAQLNGVDDVSMLGNSVYGPPVPRWRSTLSFDWSRGLWGATLSQVYSRGYVEANPLDDSLRAVGAWSSWDLQLRYAGFAGWQLAAGIRNLLDTEPPVSAQGNTFQVGYNPQAANPLGRLFYLRATYAWR